jgi:hypothetical protein
MATKSKPNGKQIVKPSIRTPIEPTKSPIAEAKPRRAATAEVAETTAALSRPPVVIDETDAAERELGLNPIALRVTYSGRYTPVRTLPGSDINEFAGDSHDTDMSATGLPGADTTSLGSAESADLTSGSRGISNVGVVRIPNEVFRLDIDGTYAQNAASGTIRTALGTSQIHWVAKLTRRSSTTTEGPIIYKNGTLAFPYDKVTISRASASTLGERRIRVLFTGPGGARRVQDYVRNSTSFRDVEFEFDSTPDAIGGTTYNTGSHPTRPADLPVRTLSIETIYRESGFDVSTSPNASSVPTTSAGADARWNDTELHDAMRVNWSRYSTNARWAMWTLFAGEYETQDLNGIMFDYHATPQRQGAALFTTTIGQGVPAGDPNPTAWRARMRFRVAIHEMGHAFNLAHSFQKSSGGWIPLADEPEARSFMNYPWRVAGGQSAFFSTFRFRFSDQELMFMRHAPDRFVQPGNAAFFDNHGEILPVGEVDEGLKLTLRTNREKNAIIASRDPSDVLEFLEPLMVELKLTNTTDEDVLVPLDTLDAGHVMLIVKKDGRPARRHRPMAHYCRDVRRTALKPGASLYEIIFAGADGSGWLADEPGRYTVQAAITVAGKSVISNLLRVRILPPNGYDQEVLAQDVLTADVANVLTFDGSNVLVGANDALREVAAQMPDSRAAVHARVALGSAASRTLKVWRDDAKGKHIDVAKVREDEAADTLGAALTDNPDTAADTLGHIDFRHYTEQYAKFLKRAGDTKEARDVVEASADALEARNVKPEAVNELRRCLDNEA